MRVIAASAAVLVLLTPLPAKHAMPGVAANPAYRLQIYSTTPAQLPAAQDWTLQYQFTVPRLPTSPTWNHSVGTVYQWGDVDFDSYGSGGKYKLSNYMFNQVTPQLILGSVLDGNDGKFKPSWDQFSTWGMQAQYYWHNSATNTSYAQTGAIIKVNPGDQIVTTISYSHDTGTMVASIRDDDAPNEVGVSTIRINRPFPNEPSLFSSWSDFFAKAAAASRTPYVLSTPAVDVETDYVDEQTMCGLLPLRLSEVSIPGVSSSPSAFTQQTNGFSCKKALVVFNFSR